MTTMRFRTTTSTSSTATMTTKIYTMTKLTPAIRNSKTTLTSNVGASSRFPDGFDCRASCLRSLPCFEYSGETPEHVLLRKCFCSPRSTGITNSFSQNDAPTTHLHKNPVFLVWLISLRFFLISESVSISYLQSSGNLFIFFCNLSMWFWRTKTFTRCFTGLYTYIKDQKKSW